VTGPKGAGSDLAGLATRVHAEGDDWRVHGQNARNERPDSWACRAIRGIASRHVDRVVP